MENSEGIELYYAAADDGDWAEIAPQTVCTLQKHLKTNQYATLTDEMHSDALVQSVITAFDSDRTLMLDQGFRVELGSYAGIPAVLFQDDLTAIYFDRADESRVIDTLTRQLAPIDVISLPESPPQSVVKALGMFELRIWVPENNRQTAARWMKRAFPAHKSIYLGDHDGLWVPADVETDLFERLDAYFERMAICTADGKLSEPEARAVAFRHITDNLSAESQSRSMEENPCVRR